MSLNQTIRRREFMTGCSAAIAALAGSRLTYTAFAGQQDEPNQHTLVVVFLRGGCDGLSLVVPKEGTDRTHYETERADLVIQRSDLLTLGSMTGINGADDIELGFHPSAQPLHELYQAGELAVIHAAGLDYGSRSHFDMMDFMERGTPGNKSIATGWLTRHLQSAPNLPDDIIAPALAVGNLQPTSLLASRETIAVNRLSDFVLNTGHWRWRDAQRLSMRNLYQSADWLGQAGIQTLDAIDIIESQNLSYQPSPGVTYNNTSISNNLQSVAQIIKLQLGLRVATIDLGGWDTHESQSNSGIQGRFAGLVDQLSDGLRSFYDDLATDTTRNYMDRITLVVLTEFGRKLIMNRSRGTDHGHGSIMFVLGGGVKGGKLYGGWPGLSNDQLYDRRDLAITTDYRRVLTEILLARLGNPFIGVVFPGYSDYQPMDLFHGGNTALLPIYDNNPYRTYIPLVVR